jgi:glycosyltransferase involved in cell wall biosynthesis
VLAAADVVLCPLRIGGGVKVKVLEALAAGKAVVTTPVGAQGLGDVVASNGLVVHESIEDLASATGELLRFPQRRRALERRARAAVRRLPSWDDAATALLSCYQMLATRPGIGDIDDVMSA